jgi:hypothetical protein
MSEVIKFPESQPDDPDRITKDVIEALQNVIAQKTGDVPHFPFVTDRNGQVHDLVEEDVRDDKGEK